MFRPSGSTGLIPPSHFQARPLPTVPRMAPTWVSDIPLVQPPTHRDVSERRPDNQRPQVIMWEQNVSGNGQEPGRRGRSVELEGSHALSQQAELISRQLQELRRLEEEVRALRETSLQQKMRLEAQAMELEALARAEKAGRAEAEGLRAALAGAEVVRKNLEEGSQRELEEVKRLHQEQLSSLTQAHQEALSSLTSKAEGLEKSLNSLETRRAGEAKELVVAQREAEVLQKQLSKTQEDLEAQVTLVENLRRYVGEQVPPEVHSQTWESERQELLETVQVREHLGGGWRWGGAAQGSDPGRGVARTEGSADDGQRLDAAGGPAWSATEAAAVPCLPPAAPARGPGQPAHHSGAAAGARAEPCAHPHHPGGGADPAGSAFRFPGARVQPEVPVPAEALAGKGVCPHGAAEGPGAGAQRTRGAAEGTGGRAPGKSRGPEPGAGRPAALPTGQSRGGGGGADGRQGPAGGAEPRSGGPAPEAAAQSSGRGAAAAGGQFCQQLSDVAPEHRGRSGARHDPAALPQQPSQLRRPQGPHHPGPDGSKTGPCSAAPGELSPTPAGHRCEP
uniref:Coiled-coil alpha-helical rod protein 1 n=1 Tax=Ursus americanus TaxID=9643 RepID=A0A452SQQ6_URSAM